MKRITANHYQTSERYYKLPKLLFESERYKDMKLEVKVAYAVLKDRLELSLSKGWIDEEGAIYLVYSNSKLMALLGCSKSKLLTIKKTRGQSQKQTGQVLNSAPSETEISETKKNETERNESVIEDEEEKKEVTFGKKQEESLTRKVDHVTKYDVGYIWNLVYERLRQEGLSRVTSEYAMVHFEDRYRYALEHMRFVNTAEAIAEYVFNGVLSEWSKQIRLNEAKKGGW